MGASNKFLVGRKGEQVVVLKLLPGPISQEDALTLAAYLVSVVDGGEEKFADVLKSVQE